MRDVERSRDGYVDVLGAELDREYGGTSVEVRAFFRDPDGYLFEISELVG